MLKIKFDKEYELKLGTLAVENIEEEYDTTIDKFLEDEKLTSKKISFILFSSTIDYPKDLKEFKKELNKYYDYEKAAILLSALISGKQSVEEMERLVKEEKAKVIDKQ